MHVDHAPRQSPFSGTRPSSAEWVLRVCFGVRCLALGQAFLWGNWERDSELFGLLLFDWSWPESIAMRLENGAIVLMVTAGIVAIASPLMISLLSERWQRIIQFAETLLLLFALAWEVAFALAITIRGGVFYSQLTLPAHALRIAIPCSLLMLDRPTNCSYRLGPSVLNILRWSTVITFAAHGWKAWELSPEYTTLVIGGWQNTFGLSMSQPTAERILRWIGGFDLLFAALLVVLRWRLVLAYVILWGAVSAMGRTIGGGWLHCPETFLRVAHAGGPLALFLEWRRQARPQQTPATGE